MAKQTFYVSDVTESRKVAKKGLQMRLGVAYAKAFVGSASVSWLPEVMTYCYDIHDTSYDIHEVMTYFI